MLSVDVCTTSVTTANTAAVRALVSHRPLRARFEPFTFSNPPILLVVNCQIPLNPYRQLMHVTRVCLLGQSASEKHNKEKGPHTFAHLVNFSPPPKCRPCLIIMQSCYCDYKTNKTFVCSRCLICVSCSATYYARKGL